MEKYKYAWAVTLRTNVSIDKILYVKEGKEVSSCWIFSDFENARENMKNLICAYANTPNKIFDGQGICKAFEKYINEIKDWELYNDPQYYDLDDDLHRLWVEIRGGYDNNPKCFWKVAKLPEILKLYLTDMDAFSSDIIPDGTWTDSLIGCKFSPNEIFVEGVEDGPCNGIDPYLLINTFNMDFPEKEYNFRIRSCFEENWDYIYIDMVRLKLDEKISFPIG